LHALAVRGAMRMLTVGFSWQLSPRARGAKQLLYALSYTPFLALALVGAMLSRARWRQLGPIYANVIGFVVVTMLFWAHTSHRVHLDVFFMILAAYTIDRWRTIEKERGATDG
jgi:drug/metabolite transporter superfamily protein YnfA